MNTFRFFKNISESTRKISMRLSLISVDVFWLTAYWIVVWSTGGPFHPELPKPSIGSHIDQPPATLVKFGFSKVKIPFFFFFFLIFYFSWSTYFEFPELVAQGVNSGQPADFRHSCGLFKFSEQISWTWNGSPHQCSGSCCCDFSSGGWRSQDSWAEGTCSPLGPLAGQWWEVLPVWQILPSS